jgi:ribonuclease VapC
MRVVVDASAIMALMLGEPGAESVLAAVRRSLMSAVNVSECCARGVERRANVEQVVEIIRSYDVEVVPFDLNDALAAGRLRAPTRSIGASAEVDPALGIDVRLIR